VLELLGDAPASAKKSATEIMLLETSLAEASLTRVERRDPYKMKHKMRPAELDAMAPNLAWKVYLAELEAPAFDIANVTAPAFFSEISKRLGSVRLAVWKDYLRFHLANAHAPYLSAAFVTEDFDFYRKYLNVPRKFSRAGSAACDWSTISSAKRSAKPSSAGYSRARRGKPR